MLVNRINSQLSKKIMQLLKLNPTYTQQTIYQQIITKHQIRLKKQVIKTGIKQYFQKRLVINQQQTNNKGINKNNSKVNSGSIVINQYQSIKKKVKKNQLSFIFQDIQEKYSFNKLGGVNKILQEIKKSIFTVIKEKQRFKALNILPCKGYLINGTLGSGKTTLGYCILSYIKKNYNINTYMCSGNQFLGQDAQSNLKRLFEEVQQNQPAIIFFDDLELLCQKQSNRRGNGSAMYSLLAQIDRIQGKDIYLLGATSSLQKIDLSLRRCGKFEKTITIPSLTEQTRKQIFQKLLSQSNHNIKDIESKLVQMTSGYVISDIISLIKQTALQCILRNSNYNQDINIQIQDFQKSINNIQPILKKQGFANIPQVKLSDVGALKQLKEELIKQIILPLKEKEKFKKMNFQINGAGVLLYGPPGCGKTMLAKAIANEARANFIIVKGPQLLTKYVGQSQEAVRKIFQRARMSSPCIIFFDEFDALAPKRQDQGNQVTQRVVNTLLNQLNGIDDRKMVFVIAATNRPDIIDDAILRSGRIQKHLYVPLPNQQERLDILSTISMKINKNQDVDLQILAKNTVGFSGADLRYLIKQSTVRAITQNRDFITQQDLLFSRKEYDKVKVSKLKQQPYQKKSQNLYNILEKQQEQGIQIQKIQKQCQIKQKKIKKDESLIIKQFIEFILKKNSK